MGHSGKSRKVDAGLPMASVYSTGPRRQVGDRKKNCGGQGLPIDGDTREGAALKVQGAT